MEEKRGRKPIKNKKIREGVYLEPELFEWMKEQAKSRGQTNSQYICDILAKAKEREG